MASDTTIIPRTDEPRKPGLRTTEREGQDTTGEGRHGSEQAAALLTLRYQSADTNANAAASSTLSLPTSAQNHDDHIQFANYPEEKLTVRQPLVNPRSPISRDSKTWVPLPLRPYFWIPLIIFLVVVGVGLEIALHFSNKRQGWDAGQSDPTGLALHYAYTLPPVIIASAVVALWAWTDIEIKKIQPYVDLVHGDSPPHRSLLLDYTRDNNFFVWTRAASNRHYLVALASLMVILTLSFQPLAAALLIVKDTWWTEPDMSLTNLAAIGLNQNLQFTDLSSFLAGAGFAGASVMYNIPPPPFIRVPYTIAPFQLPVTLTNNGTAFANTTAVKSSTGCQTVPVQMTQLPQGGWSNAASSNGCSITWEVSNNTTILFGADIPICTNPAPPQFSPVIFWFFSYVPSAAASATFCYPTLSLWDVSVGVDVATGNVTKVTEIRPFSATNTPPSNFSSLSANVTGAPLNGRAYNGVQFNLTAPDQFVLARQAAIELQLPASVYQASLRTPDGYTGSFSTGAFAGLSDKVYATYLSLVAREVYFLPDSEVINVQVKTFRKRVWLSDVAVHLLTTALLILAFFATLVQLFHRADRRHLRLKHEPGTIASAVSIGAQTGVGDVLAGRHAEKDLKEALRDRKFRIDPESMRLVMEGEEGYETAAIPPSPVSRRKSVLEILQGRRMSGRFAGVPAGGSAPGPGASTPTSLRSTVPVVRVPGSPQSPKTPTVPRSLPKTPTNAQASAV